jgi:CRP-like cAMP-binding protein
MSAGLLKKAFDAYYEFPLSMWESFFNSGEIITTEKGQVLKKSNTKEAYLYFILKGSGGILFWNENNFICTDLLFDGDFLGDHLSFILQQPTPYEVLTFERSELFRISYNDLEKFTSESEYGDRIWRYGIQALYIHKHQQQLQSLALTAKDIYRLMLQHQPSILQRIPQKYIASYLGITPQSLSRIRSEIK